MTSIVVFQPPILDKEASAPQPPHKRLAHIDFQLYFFSEIGKDDLFDRAGVATAETTHDLALYSIENRKPVTRH